MHRDETQNFVWTSDEDSSDATDTDDSPGEVEGQCDEEQNSGSASNEDSSDATTTEDSEEDEEYWDPGPSLWHREMMEERLYWEEETRRIFEALIEQARTYRNRWRQAGVALWLRVQRSLEGVRICEQGIANGSGGMRFSCGLDDPVQTSWETRRLPFEILLEENLSYAEELFQNLEELFESEIERDQTTEILEEDAHALVVESIRRSQLLIERYPSFFSLREEWWAAYEWVVAAYKKILGWIWSWPDHYEDTPQKKDAKADPAVAEKRLNVDDEKPSEQDEANAGSDEDDESSQTEDAELDLEVVMERLNVEDEDYTEQDEAESALDEEGETSQKEDAELDLEVVMERLHVGDEELTEQDEIEMGVEQEAERALQERNKVLDSDCDEESDQRQLDTHQEKTRKSERDNRERVEP